MCTDIRKPNFTWGLQNSKTAADLDDSDRSLTNAAVMSVTYLRLTAFITAFCVEGM